jgi:hypothetical protein
MSSSAVRSALPSFMYSGEDVPVGETIRQNISSSEQ